MRCNASGGSKVWEQLRAVPKAPIVSCCDAPRHCLMLDKVPNKYTSQVKHVFKSK